MNSAAVKTPLRWVLVAALTIAGGVQAAEDESSEPQGEGARWIFQTSVYTRHYHEDPRHNNHQHLLNLERWSAAGNGLGIALFDNSFGQPSQYVYGGKFWRPLDSAPLVHVKLTAGLISGYKGEYQDKIPYNGHGIAPAVLPSIGISGRRFSAEAVILWNVGAMITVGMLLN
jgi:hypothetical protein